MAEARALQASTGWRSTAAICSALVRVAEPLDVQRRKTMYLRDVIHDTDMSSKRSKGEVMKS